MAGLAFVTGCTQTIPSQVMFKGWPYEPELVRANIELFAEQSDIAVDYEAVSGNYHDKMVALFVGKMPVDCCYVRDDDLAEWIEAGWLRSYDDLPAIEEYTDDIFPYSLEAMTYAGKRYGLPYYTDFTLWIYNEAMLESAGFEGPARTLDELTEQAVKIKERTVRTLDGDHIEYPILLAFGQGTLGFNDWWALNYASELQLFDDALNPIFPDDENRGAEKILQWVVDGIHKYHTIDPNSLTTRFVRENVAAGRQAFALINKYDLEWVNNRRNSTAVEAQLQAQGILENEASYVKIYKMAPIPSIEPGQRGTLGWTRMYSLSANCPDEKVLDAWALMQFLGGKDMNGDYYTARRWFKLRGLGFAYKSLLDDPNIIAQTEEWGDVNKIKQQSQFVRTRENIKAPWFADFNLYYQPEIQKILLRQQSPRDGLGKIAKRCRELKREWT